MNEIINSINDWVIGVLGMPNHVEVWWIIAIVALVFSLYEAWWRRWFGGGDPQIDWVQEKLHISTRVIKHGLNIIAVFALCYWFRGIEWYWSLYSAIIVQIFWALAHGPWYDIGRKGPPDEKTLKRYNKVVWHKILDWCFVEEKRYGDFYDFCGMLIRYTWPMLLLFWVPGFNIGMLLIGEIVTISYALYRICQERFKDVLDVEYVVGFFTGLFLVLNGIY